VSKIVVDSVSKQFRLKADRAHSLKELVTRRGRSRDETHFWALKDVSLSIPEGSMYALVGHNGSGKSTMLRCIAGIYRPDAGKVTVDGRISTLLELGAGFHPDLSGRENIYLNATILGMGRKQIDEKFDEIVEFAGVEQFIDSPVKVYSTGMYVRLGFSVAVHVQPEILLIDEVIAVGDEEFQRKCFDHLYGLRRQGVTIVVVTHGLATVETMCDRAAWLDHGVLQMEGDAPKVAAAYLQRVNEREAEARDAGAALQTGEHGAGEPWNDGFGKDIAITGLRYTDGDGRPVSTATAGEDFVIHIGYRTSRPVKSPVFGVLIRAETGAHVSGTNTQIGGCDTGLLDGEGEVAVRFDALPLQPGYFDLTIGINDEHVQHLFDRRDREYQLIVRRGDEVPSAGLVRLDGHWSVASRPVGNGETAGRPSPVEEHVT
jgi:lipopolysaccharide transport system ATP-binding protein